MMVHDLPAELIQRLRTGDSNAMADLFAICQDRLRQMVHFRIDRSLTRRIDVDDVLQEAYIDAVKRLPHFQKTHENASAYVWLRMITLQTLSDCHRRHLGTQARDASREQLTPDQSSRATLDSFADMLVGRLTSPSQAVQRAEAIEQVQEALRKIEPIDREILALRNFEELTNKEVAEMLGIEQGTASLRYIRALKHLQQVLSQFPEAGRTW